MRRPTRHLAARAFVCLACLATGLRAQQPPSQPRPTFQASVDVVQVDVSVLDKDRKPLRGLTSADFTILEDGKPRPIVAFVPVDLPERKASPARASWVRDVSPDVTTNDVRSEGRLVVIMFDWSIRFEDQAVARRIATAAVDALGPDDLAAVVFSSAFGNAGTPQNFTADRGRLLAAINRPFAVATQNPPKGSPFHDPRNNNDKMIDDPEGYESGDCYCRMCVPEAVTRIADTVREVQGRRKTLLFIGTYFRIYESLQGPTSRQEPAFSVQALRAAGHPVVYPGTCGAHLKEARQNMARATSLANLTIHTLDPVGIETEFNSPLGGSLIGQMDRRDDLTALADSTGGRAVLNTNAPEEQVPAVFAESQSYYLLGFAPADAKPNGRLHKIEVKINRPGVSVRTRAGYYGGETRAGRTSTGESREAAGLNGVLPRSDVPLSVTVAPFAMPDKAESAVAIVLGVRQEAPPDRSSAAPVKVVAAAFDRNGKPVQSEEQTVAVAWHPDAAGNSSYEVVSRLALKPGRYEIRVALDATPSQRASVYSYVDVPDFAQQPLSLSGIVLAVSPAVPSAPPDAFTNLVPVVPSARRDFARTVRPAAFVRVYQNAKNVALPTTLTARIVDTSDRLRFNEVKSLTAEGFIPNHSADYRLELPIDRLDGGEYLLTIEAVQGKYSARRGLRFTVR